MSDVVSGRDRFNGQKGYGFIASLHCRQEELRQSNRDQDDRFERRTEIVGRNRLDLIARDRIDVV
jgi:hypothetical protein